MQFFPDAGDGHALAGAHADEIGPELGEGGEEIESELCHCIALVVERPAEGQFHASFQKPVGDGAGIWDESCQLVEFRHEQRIAFAQAARAITTAGPGSTCSPPSSSTGMRPSRRSGQTAETRRADSRARAPGPHPGHRRIPVAKAPIAALAYDSAP